MTAVQEIQAAIDKLTAVKNAPIVTALFTADISQAEWFSRTSKKLAIFHRTIDAQLAILDVAVAYGELGEGEGSRFIIAAKLLARAINGPTS